MDGQRKQEYAIKEKRYALHKSFDYNREQSSIVTIQEPAKESFKVSVGYIESREQLEWMKDLLHSEYVFLIDRQENRFIPIVIEKGKAALLDESALFNEFEIEYQLAYTENNFSIPWNE